MANSYVRLFAHIVFAVKHRNALLDDAWRERMFRYIHGVVDKRGNNCIIVGGYRDHVHILCNLKESSQELVKAIKLSTSQRIQKLYPSFHWQNGYASISVDFKNVDIIKKYIENQEEHHSQTSFGEEFKEMISEAGVNGDEQYFLHDPE